jgi:hypothetical protein
MGQHRVTNLKYHLMMISEALRVVKLLVVAGSIMILQDSRQTRHQLLILDRTMLQMVARKKVMKTMKLLVLCGNVI